MKSEMQTSVPKGSRGIPGGSKGTVGVRTPKKFSGTSVKYQGLPDSRSKNADRNQSAA